MKTLAIPTLLAAALAGCQAAPEGSDAAPAQPQAAPAAPGACALEIQFGSYAMGIDSATLQRVEALLAGERVPVQRTAWGREGEVTLCATPRTPADAERLARAVADLLPADPRGPLSITSDTGRVFRANNDNP